MCSSVKHVVALCEGSHRSTKCTDLDTYETRVCIYLMVYRPYGHRLAVCVEINRWLDDKQSEWQFSFDRYSWMPVQDELSVGGGGENESRLWCARRSFAEDNPSELIAAFGPETHPRW